MVRQISLLTKIQICNLFGINEIRFTKDKSKRARFLGLGAIWILVILLFMFYVGGMAYGFFLLGMQDMVPSMLAAVISVAVLFFTFFKAGSVIFQKKALELQISLPVRKAAIIISRFLTIYLTNVMLAFVVMLPGLGVYAVLEKPGAGFYIYGILGSFFLPLLPLTVATILGALITSVSAGWKHKSLVSAGLTLLLALGILLVSMAMSNSTEADIKLLAANMAGVLEEQIGKMYLPAIWLNDAMIGGSAVSFWLYTGASVALFAVMILILQKYFLAVCTALNSTYTNEKFRMNRLKQSSMVKSLWKKELKRYFSSSIYVTNTMIGYILMVAVSVALLIIGEGGIERMVGMPGFAERTIPVMLGALPVMMPTTACAISMEGKQWWILQSLPIPISKIYLSKILANLTVVLPFYVVSEIFALIALKPVGLGILWLILIPALYVVFGAFAGLVINKKIPVFDWDNEVRVVKQSAATFLMMIVGVTTGMVPLGCLIYMQGASVNLVMGVIVAVLTAGTGICAGLLKK